MVSRIKAILNFRAFNHWASVIVLLAQLVMVTELGALLGTSTARASFSVNVSGTTATQAILSYTAPDSNPCQIEVSESASFSPLVHDIDSALFSGANLDTRTGALTSGSA